jgi:SAM-dependent methyltransferase
VTALEQHNVEIHANAAAWSRKPLLQKIYGAFYERIVRELPAKELGPVVELGSGMGNIKRHLTDCVTTDVFPNPWLDRQENAYSLSFTDESVGAFILFDVFHHLRYPGAVLKELRRALVPQGRVVIFDPDMSVVGRLIYGVFHHEPLGLGEAIAWDAPPDFTPESHGYYAAQGNAHRVFVRKELSEALRGWRVRLVERQPALGYVAAGGFSGPQLYPAAALGLFRGMDFFARWWPAFFSTRLLVTIEKDEP